VLNGGELSRLLQGWLLLSLGGQGGGRIDVRLRSFTSLVLSPHHDGTATQHNGGIVWTEPRKENL